MFIQNTKEDESALISIQDASRWATEYLEKKVTSSNIAYLIQYALIRKFDINGSVKVSLNELIKYYSKYKNSLEKKWDINNSNLNWKLSFSDYKESETTKHVHRLHPYKGKFIPQLAEYFLDCHTDEFKKEIYFKKSDIVLDPFCGSGTTLVQANELGLNAIGTDISLFNTLISNCKLADININELEENIQIISEELNKHYLKSNIAEFESELTNELNNFNNRYFPSYEYKINIKNKSINEKKYSEEKELIFIETYYRLINQFKIDINCGQENFIDKWFIPNIREELFFTKNIINKMEIQDEIKNVLITILSRTMRSCRATTHSDLATLFEPVAKTYYCKKHYKICKPLFSIIKWWDKYSKDTIKRLKEFKKIRTETHQICLTGDSRNINLYNCIKEKDLYLYNLLIKEKISGIFSSPPYIGLIDYHEQHAYAYELFNLPRNDDKEIGSLSCGQNNKAKKNYIEGIASVLLNCKQFLKDDYNVFLVANDKFNLYPEIAEKSFMKIVNEYKRPVLNRTEKDKNPYSETIFHLKELK